MAAIRGLPSAIALLLMATLAVAVAAWLVINATASPVGAQEADGDIFLVPLVDQALGSINIDDECLVTNRRELEGPVEANGTLAIQGIMVFTSACPDGSDELDVVIKVFSVLCTKDTALETHAICDVELVAEEDTGGGESGGESGGGRGR